MNDNLFCSIYVDSHLDRTSMTKLVAELTGGRERGGGVDTTWARIAVDDDYGDAEVRARDPEDFLGWRVLLEVMPPDHAAADEVVPRVAELMRALLKHGMSTLGQADYADQLPGSGEVIRPNGSPG